MKKIVLLIFALSSIATYAQTNVKSVKHSVKKWSTTSNPYSSNVFVENLGQFNNWVQTSDTIKYALINSDKIFFTQHGLVYRVDKAETVIKTSLEENVNETDRDENPPVIEKYNIQMIWVGSNPKSVIEVSDISKGYYTFGEKGYENIKARGYKKIVYKQLYPQIDVEYTIPQKGGIEYRLVLHPGADISKVRMQYAGDVENISTDAEGNIVINTPAGAITDHAPQSFYDVSNSKIQSSFGLNDKVVSFKLNDFQSANFKTNTVIIDPWTTTPSNLAGDNSAYDIAYDYYGNVFISGGTFPFKLAKYTPTGTLLWTFTNPSTWDAAATGYSKFAIIPSSGTIFIGEGFDPSGPMVMKINSSGSLIYTTPNQTGNEEIWEMNYSSCTGVLASFGGGPMNANDMRIFADTSLTGSNCMDMDGYGTSDNDIAAVVEDYNGDFYYLISSQVSYDNHLLKNKASSNYNPPPVWDANTNYFYYECANTGIPGFANMCAGPQTVRANALALNYNYLFSYDGKTIEAWNKTNGLLLGSVVVNASYLGGQDRTHEGIAADDCNNVYVGGTNKVHVFSFNGSSFTAGTPITANIPGEVYDIRLNKITNTLYICGLGFVDVTPTTATCAPSYNNICDSIFTSYIFQVKNIFVCSDSATLNAGQYYNYSHYLWSNGDTTKTITVTASGQFYVTATFNSIDTVVDSIHVTLTHPYLTLHAGNDTTICGNATVTLNAGPGFSQYAWSTGATTPSINVNHTGIYSVYAMDTANCSYNDTVKIIINPAQTLNLGNDTSMCNYAPLTLDASAAFDSYQWSTGATTQTISVHTSGTYFVTAINNLCSVMAHDTITLVFFALPVANAGHDDTICKGSNILLLATGGSTYTWSPSAGLSCTNCANPIATPAHTTAYIVTVANSFGCAATDDVTVNVITATITTANASCGLQNGSATVTATGGSGSYYFTWSTVPAQHSQTIANLAAGTYTVTVSDNVIGCSFTQSATVAQIDVPTVTISTIINSNCGMNNGSMSASVTGGTAPFTYLWNSSPNQTTQNLTNVPPGYYCVTITDAHGCQASTCDSVNVIAFSAPEICMVSVDTSSNHNLVIWEKPVTTGINKYYVFRETSISGVYNLIGTQNYSNYSAFVDSTSNSLQQPYRYEIAINDNCSFTSPNSAYHQTVHLTINAGMSGSWNLLWNDYLGFTFSTYNIYRGTNPGNVTLLNSVSSSVTSYSDMTPPSGVVYYLIEAVRPIPCNPSKSINSTISNIASSSGLGINETGIDNDIHIYPNPAINNLTIESPHKATITITNIEGQLLINIATVDSKTNIDLSGFASGMYFVEVRTDKDVAVKKIVKE